MQQEGKPTRSTAPSGPRPQPHRIVSNFGKMLREAREAAHMTQRELVERLSEKGVELDTSAITRIEKGQREPRLREAIEISELLDFSLDLVGAPDLEEFGGETQFARYEHLMRRSMESARRKLLEACYRQHAAFDGIFSEEEEAGILARRGVSNPSEWMEAICKQMEYAFIRDDEHGRANYWMYADGAEQAMLERMVAAVTSNLLRTESEVLKTEEQNKKKHQDWLLQASRENFLDVLGPDEFERRFGGADFES